MTEFFHATIGALLASVFYFLVIMPVAASVTGEHGGMPTASGLASASFDLLEYYNSQDIMATAAAACAAAFFAVLSIRITVKSQEDQQQQQKKQAHVGKIQHHGTPHTSPLRPSPLSNAHQHQRNMTPQPLWSPIEEKPKMHLHHPHHHNQHRQKKTSTSSQSSVSVPEVNVPTTKPAIDPSVRASLQDQLRSGTLAPHALEAKVGAESSTIGAAVSLRREWLAAQGVLPDADCLRGIPHSEEAETRPEPEIYARTKGQCCENVIGTMALPLGYAGPVTLNGRKYFLPMATTEGCLVASVSRGCKAISTSTIGGINVGATAEITRRGMTRAPVLRFPDARACVMACRWLESAEGLVRCSALFRETTRHGRLVEIRCQPAGRLLFARFRAETGDAMGMNMISKGVEHVLLRLIPPKTKLSEDASTSASSSRSSSDCEQSTSLLGHPALTNAEILALSGNYCSDKKAAATNLVHGRGRSVVAEAIIPGAVVKKVLKTTTAAMCELAMAKNLVGSAVAGSLGGFNAHAANMVAALFIACGQDPAQVVASSQCFTLMEPTGLNGEDLRVSVTMPSVEVGVVGGGTNLPAQRACLRMLGCATDQLHHDMHDALLSASDSESSNDDFAQSLAASARPRNPGEAADSFAKIVAVSVMAGELSLMASLAAGSLVRSHMIHNRKPAAAPATAAAAAPAATTTTASATDEAVREAMAGMTPCQPNGPTAGVVGTEAPRAG
eukprot:Clim_evm8s211 gene=Clim_evmTU8s211